MTTTDVSTITEIQRSAPQRSSAQRQEGFIGWLMAAPAILLLFGFFILPFIMAFYFSFTNQRLISPNPTEWVGLRNFERLLSVNVLPLEPILDETTGAPLLDDEGNLTYPRVREFTRNNPDYPQYDGMQEWFAVTIGDTRQTILASDVVFMKSLVNVFYFVVVVVPVQSGLALLLAILVNQNFRGVNLFRTIYFIPVVVSMVIVSLLWRFIYDPANGLLNNMLSALTFGGFEPVDWLGNPSTSMPAILGMSIWQAVGFHMIIWLAGLQTIPGVLYEAAEVAGANNWQKFRYVTWPGLRNSYIFILITITIAAFGLFIQINEMTRGGPLDSTQTPIFQMMIRGYEKQDIAMGSAIAVVFFIIVVIVALVQRYLTRED
ncbi:MAG: sugar ABC transporter permease [Ardenticatenaceae bacterium]|nr:sugar ABC transporter permease [Ardenticatenaceae bacterium]